MKTKLLVAAVAALFSVPVFAQNMNYNAGRTTFGVRAGVNFQNINGKDANGTKLDYGVSTGFNAGVNAEIPLGAGAYLQPGVLFSQKGTEIDGDDEVKLNYIEVPVNFIYKPILGTGRLLLGAGPYAAFGLGGKVKNAGSVREVQYETTVQGNNPHILAGTYKGFDAGANFLAGYEFAQNLSFQVNAQLGLVNINPEFQGASNDQSRWRNTGVGLSLGYRF